MSRQLNMKKIKWQWVALCFLFLAAIIVLSKYRGRLFDAWPYLLILACPLLHLLMHKNHGHNHHGR